MRSLVFLLIVLSSISVYAQIYPFDIMEGKVHTVDGRVLAGSMILEDGYKKLELTQAEDKKFIFQPSQIRKVEIRILGDDEWQYMVSRKFRGMNVLVKVLAQNPTYSLFSVVHAYPVDDLQLDARRNAVFPVRRYTFKSEYYIQYLSEPLTYLGQTKNSWKKAVPGHEEDIDKFITAEQLDLANESHLLRLIAFLNTL